MLDSEDVRRRIGSGGSDSMLDRRLSLEYAAARLRISTSPSSLRLSRRSSASSFFSALLGRVWLPLLSASACASQFRRHHSLISSSFAISVIGLDR
jgi:hypothetical protein